MDRKSRILIALVFLVFILSIGVCVNKYIFQQDYLVQAQVDCDPTLEKCFIYECNPEEEECTGIPEEDTTYYKIYEKKASNLPACPFGSPECQDFSCNSNEGCREILCDENSLEEFDDGGVCSDPVDFKEVEDAEEPEGEVVDAEEQSE